MKLIAEAIENVEYICEENDGNKNYKIRGILCRGISKIVMVEYILWKS